MTLASDNIEIDVAAAPPSATAWPAIIGGALAAAAISLILMVLGSGFGLSAISPWTGVNATTVAVGSVIWLVVVQWIASGLGGYLTGRLRNRSSDPPDEAFFRDTANGFLSWALATLLVAALLTSALSAIVGTGSQAIATAVSGAAQGAGAAAGAAGSALDQTGYYVDSLFRPGTGQATANAGGTASSAASAPAATGTAAAAPAATTAPAATAPADTTTTAAAPGATAPMAMAPAPAPAAGGSPASGGMASTAAPAAESNADLRAETTRILVNGVAAKEFPAADVDYLSQVVASRTGLSADDARQRVTDTVQSLQTLKADAVTAADNARKAGAKLALYMFLSLIIGAFIAATAAALGGGHRDEQFVRTLR